MKIVIITSRYPSKNEPYNHMFVHMRSLEMKKNNIDVSVYVPSKNIREYIYEGIKVLMLPSKEIIKKDHSNSVLYLHLLNIYPFSKDDGWPIYKYIYKNNIPFAMYVHGSEVQKYGSRMFEFNYKIVDFLKWFKKDILVIPKMKYFIKKVKNRTNSAFIFPSIWMKNEMEENLSQKIEEFSIIPNGIDAELFKYHNLIKNKYKLLTLRPLSSKKYAVDIAIEVMQYLPKEFTLEIYGKGKYKDNYLKQIKALNLDRRVFIKNEFIERAKLNDFFSNFGIFLSPTRMDAQGVTMCEAMASGLLTVSNDNTAIPEFITNNQNGVLANEPKLIAKEIFKIVENDYLFNEITQNARLSMENIDSSKTVMKELLVLEKLIIK